MLQLSWWEQFILSAARAFYLSGAVQWARGATNAIRSCFMRAPAVLVRFGAYVLVAR
jgi:hypothetical protein